jgi:hypothetical protein
MTVSTNTVTEENGRYTIRFAMVAQDTTAGYTSAGTTKVATILTTPGTGGAISLKFNEQNSRARTTTGGTDMLLAVTPATYTVAAGAEETVAVATGSSALVSTQTGSTPAPNSFAPYCLLQCVSDNDCAAGLTCEADRCVNPACPTSQTCGCGTSAVATPRPTSTLVAVSTPLATTIPTPTTVIASVPTASTSGETLPAAGSTAQTVLVLGAGLLFLGGGFLLPVKK